MIKKKITFIEIEDDDDDDDDDDLYKEFVLII